MTGDNLEIAPADVDAAEFDAILDIRFGREQDPVFTSAINVDANELARDPLRFVNANDRVLVVCDIGLRSKTAVEGLRLAGVPASVSLAGGADALRRMRATSGPASLSADEVERYDRQIRLAGFGIEGQRNLAAATITVVGAGGLGCPALSYLATAGVGSIVVIDPDIVDLANLHRQPLYATDDVGIPKVKAAAARLHALNPEVVVSAVEEMVTEQNARTVIAGSDVVIDATDNFAVRYALNSACIALGGPMIYASVYGFEGQLAVFDSTVGPCYRCLFPVDPSGDAVLDCSTVGVLGAVTGIIGSLQASAAIQIAAGVDHGLYGTLTLFNARQGRFDQLSIAKRPNCQACGE